MQLHTLYMQVMSNAAKGVVFFVSPVYRANHQPLGPPGQAIWPDDITPYTRKSCLLLVIYNPFLVRRSVDCVEITAGNEPSGR